MKQHSAHFLDLVNAAKQNIQEITAETLNSKLSSDQPIVVLDVREDQEYAAGQIASAIHLSKGLVERDIEKIIPDLQTEIVVYCSGGFRSALVAQNLQNMGYQNVSSLDTGLQGWIAAGYPIHQS